VEVGPHEVGPHAARHALALNFGATVYTDPLRRQRRILLFMNDRPYGWMYLQALDLVEEADRLQRRFLRYLGPAGEGVSWEPPVDIHEGPEGIIVLFALPGVLPEDIVVRVDDAALTVNAVRRARCALNDALIRRLEIPHGRFVRQIPLAGRRLKIAQSQYVNGCLEVRLVPADSSE
jgi:HSP20 family protein